MEPRPILPVAPLSASSATALQVARELEAHEVDPGVVAGLVRARLALERARGWVSFLGIITTVAGVVGLALTVESKGLLAVLAPLVASVPFGAVLFAERLAWFSFSRSARELGLSEKACRRIFEGAAGADHWIDVLSSCGRPPTDQEIARFVVDREEALAASA
ncbi:MAG: hypothetical protein IT382_14545 [Deltaproteobacteria bacterium]|nr:hypothetical protein [Deltaproteobacteria bacterium]